MPFVLDASVALAWLLPDEVSDAVDALADRIAEDAAVVPAIWTLEIGNALLTAERRGRISRKERDRCLQLLTAIQVAVDAPFPLAKLADLVKLASDHDLTTYDASYLLLARERGLALATVDQHMRKASAKLRIRVLP